MSQPRPSDVPPAKSESAVGCLVRIVWMLLGNAALAFAAMRIAMGRGFRWSAADTAYWAIAAGLVLLRLVDVSVLKGQTVTGEAATLAHWRRYALILLGTATLVWGTAHGYSWTK